MVATQGYVEIEGGRLYYERAGEGFPVVLIHPSLWDSRIWDPQFEEFAQHHDVVRYDVRGYGRSDLPISRTPTFGICGTCWASWGSAVARSSGARSAPSWRSMSPSPSRTSPTRSSRSRRA